MKNKLIKKAEKLFVKYKNNLSLSIKEFDGTIYLLLKKGKEIIDMIIWVYTDDNITSTHEIEQKQKIKK